MNALGVSAQKYYRDHPEDAPPTIQFETCYYYIITVSITCNVNFPLGLVNDTLLFIKLSCIKQGMIVLDAAWTANIGIIQN